MLHAGEFGAIEAWAQLEPAMQARHGEQAREIGRRIRTFEHEAALGLLQSLVDEAA